MAPSWFLFGRSSRGAITRLSQVFLVRNSLLSHKLGPKAESRTSTNPWIRLLVKLILGGAAGGACLYQLQGKQSGGSSFDITARISNWPPDMTPTLWQEAWRQMDCQSAAALVPEIGTSGNVGTVFLQIPKSVSVPSLPGSNDMERNKRDNYSKEEVECFTRHTIPDAVAKAAPAVVNITISVGGWGMLVGQASGSGFIINPDGVILTNAHVVADAGNGFYKGKMVVTLDDGRTFDGEVTNYDSAADIAVVKIKCQTALPTVSFGSSHKLRPGEWVIALGSPLHLSNSVTVGVVSCVDRKSSEIGLRGLRSDYIQTDAAINQGNSGGPLLNLDGEVIGINTMKAFAADGISFAIPIDTAVKVVDQLKKHGRVVRPWLGIKMLELNEHIIVQLKERDPRFPHVRGGVLVPQVIPGSPAERAGLRPGDVIIKFDGKPITNINQIVESLGDKVGVPITIVVKRANDQEAVITIIPEEASPSK